MGRRRSSSSMAVGVLERGTHVFRLVPETALAQSKAVL
jgi:hypothetical protein